MEQFKLEPLKDPRGHASPIPSVAVVLGAAAVAVAGSGAVLVFSPANALGLVIQICGFCVVTATCALAYMQSRVTHDMVNSDLEKWIASAGQVRYDMGMQQGRADADARTDNLRDELKKGPNG